MVQTITKETIDKAKVVFPRRKRHSLVDWFMLKEEQVLDKFASLPTAQKIGTGDKSFVFIPGTRDDRMVLVAHADTVWNDKPMSIGYSAGNYFSTNEHVGIGADDRAGCKICWDLKDLGHSILIPNSEESGCEGSRFLGSQPEWSDIINGHKFAIEMDRRGGNDLIFYDVGSTKFTEWCEEKFPTYKKAHGSFTDICVLCKTICGLNISIGYYDQHFESEHLKDWEWHRTRDLLRNVLSQKDLPQFIQDPKPKWENTYVTRDHHNGQFQSRKSINEFETYDEYFSSRNGTVLTKTPKEEVVLDSIIVCPYCDFTQDIGEWKVNGEKCIDCQREI